MVGLYHPVEREPGPAGLSSVASRSDSRPCPQPRRTDPAAGPAQRRRRRRDDNHTEPVLERGGHLRPHLRVAQLGEQPRPRAADTPPPVTEEPEPATARCGSRPRPHRPSRTARSGQLTQMTWREPATGHPDDTTDGRIRAQWSSSRTRRLGGRPSYRSSATSPRADTPSTSASLTHTTQPCGTVDQRGVFGPTRRAEIRRDKHCE